MKLGKAGLNEKPSSGYRTMTDTAVKRNCSTPLAFGIKVGCVEYTDTH